MYLHTVSCVCFTSVFPTHTLTICKKNLSKILNRKGNDSNNNTSEHDSIAPQQDKTQHEIIRQCNSAETDIIDARSLCKQSFLYTIHHQSAASQTISSNNSESFSVHRTTYYVMLQMIDGSMIGERVYTTVYDDLDKEEDNSDRVVSSNKFGMPLVPGINRKVAKAEKTSSSEIVYCF